MRISVIYHDQTISYINEKMLFLPSHYHIDNKLHCSSITNISKVKSWLVKQNMNNKDNI